MPGPEAVSSLSSPEVDHESASNPIRIGINGFGRIGRNFFRANMAQGNPLEIVAANDAGGNVGQLAYLLEFDSTAGRLKADVSHDEASIALNGVRMPLFEETDPTKLPWKDLGVDIVIESTGKFTEKDKAEQHLEAGARKVIISAPAKGDVTTLVMGINEGDYNVHRDSVVSNASCTTNCLAPLAYALDLAYDIEYGTMLTTHAYTADQNLQDGPHREDNRRARAAAENIVPSSTGAARAIGLVLPQLAGRLDGFSLRVPIPVGSLVTLSAHVNDKAQSVEDINAVYTDAASTGGYLEGILEYSDKPLVSKDIVGNPHSAIFDAGLTTLVGDQIMVSAWYDNEWGFSNRMVELAKYIGDSLADLPPRI